MYSPMTPCGPDSVVMNPIFTFCCAAAGAAETSAAIASAPRKFSSWPFSSLLVSDSV
jgi:hypothetical protein